MSQSLLNNFAVSTCNGSLSLNISEKSDVEILILNLHGKTILKKKKTFSAGIHPIVLPKLGAGVYLYKFKSGNNDFLLKSTSIGGVSKGTTLNNQNNNFKTISRNARGYAPFKDVIVATKDGYLNYKVLITNTDTSGIEISMIICEGTVTDADGNKYQTVKIGNQVWTVENLRTTKYNDGSAILHLTDSLLWIDDTLGGYCFYNNTVNEDSIKKLGGLYNWYTVGTKKLAPKGWHVPSDEEWDTLEIYLTANGYNWDGTTDSSKIAKSIAARTNWRFNLTDGVVGNNLKVNNKSGFSGLPTGIRNIFGKFFNIEYSGHWWSSTLSEETRPFGRILAHDRESLFRGGGINKSSGFSVRLVQD